MENSETSLYDQLLHYLVIGILALTVGFALAYFLTQTGLLHTTDGAKPVAIATPQLINGGKRVPAFGSEATRHATVAVRILAPWAIHGKKLFQPMLSDEATLITRPNRLHLQPTSAPWAMQGGRKVPVVALLP